MIIKPEPVLEFMRFFPFDIKLVGGGVRDLVMGKSLEEVKDLDFSIPFSPDDFLTIMSTLVGYDKLKHLDRTGSRFGVLAFQHAIGKVDFVSRRRETYTPGSRKPITKYDATLDEDLERRDFTFNAMSMNKYGLIYDPFNGLEHIKDKLVVPIGGEEHWKQDPLRILRAIRFAIRFKFQIKEDYWDEADLLSLSKQRITEEMDKMLEFEPAKSLAYLFDYGVMDYILPEMTRSAEYKFRVRFKGSNAVDAWAGIFKAILHDRHYKLTHSQPLVEDFITKQGVHFKWSKERIQETIERSGRVYDAH